MVSLSFVSTIFTVRAIFDNFANIDSRESAAMRSSFFVGENSLPNPGADRHKKPLGVSQAMVNQNVGALQG